MIAAWKVVTRAGNVPEDKPVVTLIEKQVYFNSVLAKLAELDKHGHVEFYVDEESFKLGFRFFSDKTKNSNKLVFDQRSAKVKKVTVAAGKLYSQNPWLAEISKLRERTLRRFVAEEESRGFWVINVRPSFETRAKEPAGIPSGAKGIYRYRLKDETMYIGEGDIKSRCGDADRKEWEFDKIEYSIIEDETLRRKWEKFWIDKYKQEHDGSLPPYNRQGGG